MEQEAEVLSRKEKRKKTVLGALLNFSVRFYRTKKGKAAAAP